MNTLQTDSFPTSEKLNVVLDLKTGQYLTEVPTEYLIEPSTGISELLRFGAGVYKAASVSDEPQVRIHNWQIMHMKEGDFFCGNEGYGSGRASTRIVEFDATTKKGRTQSGRIYELVGEPAASLNSDAAYVWGVYARVNNLTPLDECDVNTL